MRLAFRTFVAAAVLASSASPADAATGKQPPRWRIKNLQFQKKPPKPAVTAHGYYVGPFTGTLTSDPTRPTLNLFCVDVLNSITWGHEWTGVFTRLSSNDLSSTRHGDGAKGQYQKAAYLASMYRAPGVTTGQWGGIQTAIWNLLNPGNPNGGANPLNTSSEAYWLAQADTWYGSSEAQTFDYSRWSIVTDEDAAGLTQGGGTQEFLTDASATPEPETWLLLATGLVTVLGVAASRGVFRG